MRIKFFSTLTALMFYSFCTLAQSTPAVQSILPDLLAHYHHLHAHPELSFHEKATSTYLAKDLRQLGYEVTEGVGGYGIVAVLENGQGPIILVRTDMDALPIVEKTGLPYASEVTTTDATGKTVGVMHACGHDMHMTVWLGVARQLMAQRAAWSGKLILVGQPAEERASGAKAMLADGLYQRFGVPDYALAFHVKSNLAAGQIGYRSGYSMANVDMVDIAVFGRGGHGAYPHTTIDPVVLAARIVLDLQTLVSREISPLEPAVLTVGSIHGGSKGNVIPDRVDLELTLRSYSAEVREHLLSGIQRIIENVARSTGLPDSLLPKMTLRPETTAALFNNRALTERVVKTLQTNMGKKRIVEVPSVMGGEDFSYYGQTEEQVPVLLLWLGSIDAERARAGAAGEISLPSLHSAGFAPLPEPTIATGVEAMTLAVLDLMKRK